MSSSNTVEDVIKAKLPKKPAVAATSTCGPKLSNVNRKNNKNVAAMLPAMSSGTSSQLTASKPMRSLIADSNAKFESDVKNYLQSNNITGSKYVRLTSFAPRRDLTLGGLTGPCTTTLSAKVVPNLNVVRRKNIVGAAKEPTANVRERGRGRGRGRGAAGAGAGQRHKDAQRNIIQTTGIFSEGGPLKKKKPMAARFQRPAAGEMKNVTLSRPIINSKKDAEQTEIEEEISSESECDDLIDFKSKEGFMPVQLFDVSAADCANNMPLKRKKLQNKNQEQDLAVKSNSINRLTTFPRSVEDLFQPNERKQFYLQLPDELPCEEENSILLDKKQNFRFTNASSPATSTANDSDSKRKLPRPNLMADKHGGQIGKLVRYKSGKIEMLLGQTKFDLRVGTDPCFTQDVVAFKCNQEERSGEMKSIGVALGKITATPNWQHLV